MGLRQVEKEGGGWVNIFLSEVTSKSMSPDGCLGRTGDSISRSRDGMCQDPEGAGIRCWGEGVKYFE